MSVRRMKFGVGGQLVEHTLDGVPQSLEHQQIVRTLVYGVGTELKKLLSKLGLKPTANCKCNQRIAYMNQQGIHWCEQNIDTISGWLKEEADRARLPFVEVGAQLVIKRAISNAKIKA